MHRVRRELLAPQAEVLALPLVEVVIRSFALTTTATPK
jgi:hypothetical protein